MGVEKTFFYVFFNSKFHIKGVKKMNENNATELDLSVPDTNFYKIIYQRILSLKKSKEKFDLWI